ncbi:MAG: DUF3267 domain-containing protein [Clostridia bacterium]|nr:DUF3267 domain-containing protein [Clostridia bacterium]
MKSVKVLPEGYSESISIDLQKNKKQLITVNAICVLITVAMLVAAVILRGFSGITPDDLAFAAIITAVGCFVYLILHELTHGLFMIIFGCRWPHYGFSGLYAFAGADFYFSKWHYVIIALAPVVLLGGVLAVLNVVLPPLWFYPVYFIQVMNVSGAAGDLYVTARLLKAPRDILVYDTGTAMRVYSK